ncbi:MAG TPA: hypothetical protein VNZ26_35580, partial [Vicinamibacterales bacterium]|nr:hypothetical protein [Vicinamibacterales bacterium]
PNVDNDRIVRGKRRRRFQRENRAEFGIADEIAQRSPNPSRESGNTSRERGESGIANELANKSPKATSNLTAT